MKDRPRLLHGRGRRFLLQRRLFGLAVAVTILASACSKTVHSPGQLPQEGSSSSIHLFSSPPPSGLEEAGSAAARTSDLRIEYVLETASRKGRLVYANRAEKTSWRLEQDVLQPRGGASRGSLEVSAYVLETPSETVFCLLENRWRCLKGESYRDAGPALFDKRSFEFLARVAPFIPPDSFKKKEDSLAGYPASCFDIVPQLQLFAGSQDEDASGSAPVPPLVEIEGVDTSSLEALRNSLIVEVLYKGGTLCFGSGALLKLVVLDEELFTITAQTVSPSSDADFDPPGEPEYVGSPSPFPSVIKAT